MIARRWLRRHRHLGGLRHVLGLAERAYEIALSLRSSDPRPAYAGGWPARIVPLPPPQPFTRSERRELSRAMRAQNTSYSDGDAISRFEEALAASFGARHAVAVSSGTAALHTAFAAAGIGPGDEVIVPVLTHASCALAVLHRGAAPRFVDVDPRSWNLDPGRVEEAITERTRAILAVHLCGVPCDMRALRKLAARHGLVLVEDAAQAHGTRIDGRLAGTVGDLGCLSFQSSKTLTTGEGGAVLTEQDDLARRVRLAMNLGEANARGRATWDLTDFPPGTELVYETVGWNHRMGAQQAALGIGQLARFDAIVGRRRAHASQLALELGGLPGLRPQVAPPGADPCLSSYFVELEEREGLPARDELARALADERIDHRLPYRKTLAEHPILGAPGRFPVAERISRNAIGFRLDPGFTRSDIRSISFAVRRILAWSGRDARR